MELRAIAAVGLGAAIGGILRYVLSQLIVQRFGSALPYATLFINVSGSILIGGLFEVVHMRGGAAPNLTWLFAAVGILGGYTTFSTFSFETVALLGSNAVLGVAYACGSVLLGCTGAWAGMALTRIALR
jgi:CrcB protein